MSFLLDFFVHSVEPCNLQKVEVNYMEREGKDLEWAKKCGKKGKRKIKMKAKKREKKGKGGGKGGREKRGKKLKGKWED